jgi:hypothetical protein
MTNEPTRDPNKQPPHDDVHDAGAPNITLKGSTLQSTERGLVIGEPFIGVSPDGGTQHTIIVDRRIDPTNLRFSLLFWDRLDEPVYTSKALVDLLWWEPEPFSPVYTKEDDSTRQFLRSAGILQHSFMTGGENGDDVIRKAAPHLPIYRALDQRDNGRWSFARHERSAYSLPLPELERGRGLLFEIYDSIPVPTKDVPLDDILGFKQKRYSELLEFRFHLEKLYQSILEAPDRPLAKATALGELDKAISGYIRTIRERKFPFKLGGFQAKLSLDKLLAGLGAYFTSTAAGLSQSGALLTGLTAFAGSASLSATAGLRDRKSSSVAPFEYVAKYNRAFYG